MRRRPGGSRNKDRRTAWIAGILACLFLASSPAHAVLLPDNFFDKVPGVNAGQAGIEADQLFYDSNSTTVTANGQVSVSYAGYYATADRLTFNRTTRDLHLSGNVKIVDPNGVEYTSDDVSVTGGFKTAILQQMILVTKDGAMVTADSTEKIYGVSTTLINGSYSPCGTCIDKNGRRIGWRVRADKFFQNTVEGYVEADNPVLEILGVPIAWVPWLRMPDPSDPRQSGFRLPSAEFNAKVGAKFTLPYYAPVDQDMAVLFLPSLVSTQGLLMGAEFSHNVGTNGRYSVAAYGIYQLDPGAFSAGYGDTEWRGAIQTSGHFTPAEHWSAGWSYSAFSDRAFLSDYMIDDSGVLTNEVYVQHLSTDTFADVRMQEFSRQGEISQAEQNKQALALPTARAEHVAELGNDGGQVRLSGTLLGVERAADDTRSNGVAYVLGYEGRKVHGTGEAVWSKQIVLGSAAVTPYAGLRIDAADYNGASALNPVPSSLLTATPLAAIDVRVPFVARADGSTHLLEPIGQLYYRGEGTSETGINNDNAQSFVLDDTNIFSFNKFSGTDRQETGLNANIGLHYLASLNDLGWVDFVVGQSFHLAGPNGLTTADDALAGVGAGMDGAHTNVVAGVRGELGSTTFGAKASIDPDTLSIDQFSAVAQRAYQGWRFGGDYSYAAPDPARGYTATQQDVGAFVAVPFDEYWVANANANWDITGGQLIDYGVGLTYDDKFFMVGAQVTSSGPLIYDPSQLSYRLSLKLKGPDGTGIGF